MSVTVRIGVTRRPPPDFYDMVDAVSAARETAELADAASERLRKQYADALDHSFLAQADLDAAVAKLRAAL